MSNYNFTELEKVMHDWQRDDGLEWLPREVYPPDDTVSFIVKGIEMLKIQEDGFYVRGKKVNINLKEGEEVFSALKEFLVWQRLNRE